MTYGISHFAIKVRDLAGAERFYCGVLGLEVDRRWPNADGTGLRSLWLKTGDGDGTFLALELVQSGASARERGAQTDESGHHLLALRITRHQRAGYESRLAAAGFPVTHRTGFTIYFRDPEGNRLALSHYPDVHPAPAAGGAAPVV